MSSRLNFIATSALLLVALQFAPATVQAADANSTHSELCAVNSRVSFRPSGHPAKSAMMPSPEIRITPAQCKVTQRKPLVLASQIDAPGGRSLVSGRTERAIEQIQANQRGSTSRAALNNLCVAYTMLRQWPQASDSCDLAVAKAVSERDSIGNRRGPQRKVLDTYAAVAYSNRAVMFLLSRDINAAHNDLAKARAYSPNSPFVTRNSEVARSSPTLAMTAQIARVK